MIQKTSAALAIAGLSVILLTSCAPGKDGTQEVRPLVTATEGDFTVVARDDKSVQDMLLRAKDAILTVANGKAWTALSNDDLNEEIIEVTFVERDRSPNRYGGGTEATSTLIRKNTAILAMSGENGSCWGLRMKRQGSDARLMYTSIFSPECTAEELEGATVEWAETWPERAVPGKDFVPPAVPDGSIPGGLTPEQLNPEPSGSPTPGPGGSAPAPSQTP